jgi:hypothetical protein
MIAEPPLENTYGAPFGGKLAREPQAGETRADDDRVEASVTMHRFVHHPMRPSPFG